MSGLLARLLARLAGRTSPESPAGQGAVWENFAADFLRRKGFEVIGRNVRTRRGEIDIIALDNDEIVFVEVKARNSREFGGPAAGIDRGKRDRLSSAAKEFLVRKRLTDSPCRFDAVLIYTGADTPEVEHIENAFPGVRI